MPRANQGPETSERRRRETSVQRALRAAVKATTTAAQAAAVWADLVRMGAENRLGVGALDRKVFEDPEYSDALDRFKRLVALKEEAKRQLEAWEGPQLG